MLTNYVKIALRNIKRHKGYSFINIMGLAIGMACCILILLWVQDELSFDTFHDNYDDLYTTIPKIKDTRYYSNPLAFAPTLRGRYSEVLKITRFCQRWWLIKYGDKSFNESGGLVDDDFLKMFTFPLVKGSPETVFASRESIVITERTAEKFFGDKEPIGNLS